MFPRPNLFLCYNSLAYFVIPVLVLSNTVLQYINPVTAAEKPSQNLSSDHQIHSLNLCLKFSCLFASLHMKRHLRKVSPHCLFTIDSHIPLHPQFDKIVARKASKSFIPNYPFFAPVVIILLN